MTKVLIEVDTSDKASVAAAAETIALLTGSPTSAGKSTTKPAKAAKETAPAEPEEKEEEEEETSSDDSGGEDRPDREAVRAKLKELAGVEGKDAAITLLKKHGKADNMAKLDEKHFQAVYDEAVKAIDAASI